MAIDQSKLGAQVQQLMQEIEEDDQIPENAQIGRVVVVVEVIGPAGESDSFTQVKVSASARPYVALGLLEVGSRIQLKMMGLD